jgi:hypothetical protein
MDIHFATLYKFRHTKHSKRDTLAIVKSLGEKRSFHTWIKSISLMESMHIKSLHFLV